MQTESGAIVTGIFRASAAALAALAGFCALHAQEQRKTEPTFLYRQVSSVAAGKSDFTTASCRYLPVFGAGASDARVLRGIARFGEIEIDPAGASATAAFAGEEQAYFVLEGAAVLRYGAEEHALRKDDFFYTAPGVPLAFRNSGQQPARLVLAGFRIPEGAAGSGAPGKLMLANLDEVRAQTVEGHPPSTLYRLMMGDTRSKRDKLAAAQVLTSMFIMEFAPGGTNIPHHHETEEEIYLILNGHGQIVAGGGADGIENRRAARAGDAYFFRLNATVGFYSGNKPGEENARILAFRSLFPFGK